MSGPEWVRRGQVWCSHRLLPLDSKPTRVLVTGSRTWPVSLEHHIVDALGFYWELGGHLTVVHGDCPNGADRMARQWCERMNSGVMGQVVDEERHPADWRRLGKQAGHVRNFQMVDLGADVCLAFLDVCRKPTCTLPKPHPSHGADHCATDAADSGIEVVRYRTWEPDVVVVD